MCGELETERPLPSRLLDVGSGDALTLVDTYAKRGRYVCLSYCWGGRSDFVTTTSNIDRHKQFISLGTLPKTLRDAVVLTRALRIRYLWIDALCIIQDDKLDVDIETAGMQSIYANSALTIAAAVSDHVQNGFLTSTRREKDKSFRLNGTWNGRPYRIHFRRVQHVDTQRPMDIRYWPSTYSQVQRDLQLDTRGWTYQEHMLPTRVVEFTESEMIWSCQTERVCECMISNHSDPRKDKQKYHRSLLNHATDPAELRMLWHTIVREYCSRALTFPLNDKLPAISGIAEQIHQVTGSKYYAGIWEHSLLSDLLWKPHLGYQETSMDLKAYQAPSWSWASRNRPITYDNERFNQDDDEKLRVQILSIGTMLTTINLVGSLSDGYLIARGYTIVTRTKTDPKAYTDSTIDQVVTLELPNHEEFTFTPDYPLAMCYPDNQEFVEHVTVLLMRAETRYHNTLHTSVLFLRPLVNQRGSYQRIGCTNRYFDNKEKLLEMAKIITVRIV